MPCRCGGGADALGFVQDAGGDGGADFLAGRMIYCGNESLMACVLEAQASPVLQAQFDELQPSIQQLREQGKAVILVMSDQEFLGLVGLLSPATGALVHNAGSVLVVLNAARLYERRI